MWKALKLITLYLTGLTAIQVSGTNGIILISQPINTSPVASNSLTFGNDSLITIGYYYI